MAWWNLITDYWSLITDYWSLKAARAGFSITPPLHHSALDSVRGFGLFRVAYHQAIDVRDGLDVRRDVRLICQERGVTVLVARVVSVHGADRALAHVAGHNQHTFVG